MVRFAEVDLNEDDEDMEKNSSEKSEDEESGEDEEFIDVLDILDGRANVEDTEEGSDASKAVQHHNEDILPSDDDETLPEALDELHNFISALDTTAPKKRKAPDSDAPPSQIDSERSRKHRRVALKERTEAGPENEFHPSSSGMSLFHLLNTQNLKISSKQGTKLNLDDLLAPLASSSQSQTLQSLKKSTKALLPSSSAKVQVLAAPLPQRAQERLDREAAYEQTKEEVDKWSATMKRIREVSDCVTPAVFIPTFFFSLFFFFLLRPSI